MNIPDNMPWCEKHRASCFRDIRGQDAVIDQIKIFLKEFPKKRSILLHGGPGTGKTSLAYVIAFELDAEILELNASDLRNREQIDKIIRPASVQQPLFKKKKILLIDEVDGIAGRKDAGGLDELIYLIEKSAYPVIITANDIWDSKFSKLRSSSEMVQLKELNYKTVLDILKSVCEKEKCTVANDTLTSIAIKSKGDIRAALNDLQLVSQTGLSIPKDFGDREKKESIFSALQYIFKNAVLDEKMLNVLENVDMPLNEIILWVEENIPLEYQGEELAKAYRSLSLSDLFGGRIYRHQHWRFLVYQYFLLGPGVASAKKNNRYGWTNYKKPGRILKIWMQNQRTFKKKSICEKYAKYCHISIKQAMKDFLLIKILLRNSPAQKELRLSEEEMEYLKL